MFKLTSSHLFYFFIIPNAFNTNYACSSNMTMSTRIYINNNI